MQINTLKKIIISPALIKSSWILYDFYSKSKFLLNVTQSPMVCKEIQPVHTKGDQSWVFIGGTDVEAETPILWQPDAEIWLIWKDLDAGNDWGQEEKGTTEDEMVGWHHWHNGHGFGWTPGVGDGQGGLVYWVHGVANSQTRLSDWTELKMSA